MTKEELKSKISNIMDEAIKIKRIEGIVNDMEKTMNNDCLSEITKDAAYIGYCDMLRKTHKEIQFIWLHLYDLRADVDGIKAVSDYIVVPSEDQPTEEEITEVREVTGDD